MAVLKITLCSFILIIVLSFCACAKEKLEPSDPNYWREEASKISGNRIKDIVGNNNDNPKPTHIPYYERLSDDDKKATRKIAEDAAFDKNGIDYSDLEVADENGCSLYSIYSKYSPGNLIIYSYKTSDGEKFIVVARRASTDAWEIVYHE